MMSLTMMWTPDQMDGLNPVLGRISKDVAKDTD